MVFSNLKARSCLIRKAPREQHLPDVSAKNVTGSHCFYIVLHFLIPWNIEACSLQSECGSLSVSFLKVASQEEFQGGSFSLTSSSCESIKSDNGTCGPMSSQYKSMAAGMTTKTSSGHVMYTSKTIGQIGSGFFESSRNRSWMNSTLGGSYWTGLSLPSTWGSSLHTFGSRTVPNNSLDSTPSKKPWEPNLKPPGKKNVAPDPPAWSRAQTLLWPPEPPWSPLPRALASLPPVPGPVCRRRSGHRFALVGVGESSATNVAAVQHSWPRSAGKNGDPKEQTANAAGAPLEKLQEWLVPKDLVRMGQNLGTHRLSCRGKF